MQRALVASSSKSAPDLKKRSTASVFSSKASVRNWLRQRLACMRRVLKLRCHAALLQRGGKRLDVRTTPSFHQQFVCHSCRLLLELSSARSCSSFIRRAADPQSAQVLAQALRVRFLKMLPLH